MQHEGRGGRGSNGKGVRICFTGSRSGVSASQPAELERLLRELVPTELHHGGCAGVDAEAHVIALRLGVPQVVGYLSNIPELTAVSRREDERTTVTVLPARMPVARNRGLARMC